MLKNKKKIKCDRYCNKITTATMNVYIKYGDNLHTAECKRAIAFNEANGKEPTKLIQSGDRHHIWTEEETNGVLFATCTDIFKINNNNFR